MAMWRRKRETQLELWIAKSEVVRTARHVFYAELNGLLAEAARMQRRQIQRNLNWMRDEFQVPIVDIKHPGRGAIRLTPLPS